MYTAEPIYPFQAGIGKADHIIISSLYCLACGQNEIWDIIYVTSPNAHHLEKVHEASLSLIKTPIDRIHAIICIHPSITDTQTNTLDW